MAAAREQLVRLNATITRVTDVLSDVSLRRATVADELVRLQARRRAAASRLTELRELNARFELLSQQYVSDYDRLSTVREVGSLLSLLQPDRCILCGSDLTSVFHGTHPQQDIGVAATAEMAKVAALGSELQVTRNGINSEVMGLDQEISQNLADEGWLVSELADLDRQLQPIQVNLDDELKVRSELDRAISAYDQIKLVELLRSKTLEDQSPPPHGISTLSAADQRRFCDVLSEVLNMWGVPGSSSVHLGPKLEDVFVGGRARSTRGKGMRAVIHSAFTLSLMKFCAANDLPHPGFVVLDSPLVTYREADDPEGISRESFSTRFYNSLGAMGGQVVVLENVSPDAHSDVASDQRFTQVVGYGRYGFYPLAP